MVHYQRHSPVLLKTYVPGVEYPPKRAEVACYYQTGQAHHKIQLWLLFLMPAGRLCSTWLNIRGAGGPSQQ